ncbi:hypothetical protein [uncultured Roseobacter sp.]|uniref:hypothetical protein n=1 Tax=uncultured Roseobacter sp. TaxID=114847 RepID=UPI002618D30A|nr:hypothetical protein [uncultured Roseobacter sp.]
MIRLSEISALTGTILCLLAGPSLAQPPMNAQEFDEYTRGKTLFYGENGVAYGAEEYLDNRRVIWSFLDGECKSGTWYEQADQICFVYEDNPNPQCWTFHKEEGRLVARFQNAPGMTELYEAGDFDDEMICLGPRIGV